MFSKARSLFQVYGFSSGIETTATYQCLFFHATTTTEVDFSIKTNTSLPLIGVINVLLLLLLLLLKCQKRSNLKL